MSQLQTTFGIADYQTNWAWWLEYSYIVDFDKRAEEAIHQRSTFACI